jgi:putative effector of murein hydrolase LrgA (UPF0299 family)
MSDFQLKYTVGWLAFCVLALVLAVKDIRPAWRDELAFLTVPWKLMLFLPAIVFVTFAGRFTNDETWDVVTGGGMAVLTFLTSGWAVGSAYKALRRQRPRSTFLVALAVALFSSSWFYDGYLLLRDGAYTQRWLGNLMLSPFAYVSAGLVMNLEARGRGVALGFTRADWPRPATRKPSVWLVLSAAPFILVALWILVGFVRWSPTPK